MNIRTVGTAERYSGVVPVATFDTLARSPEVTDVCDTTFTLQTAGKLLLAWLPKPSTQNREALWGRIQAERLKVWESQLNPAIVGLGLLENQWALIYDRDVVADILRTGYDQLSIGALHRRSKKRDELQALTDQQRVQAEFFRNNLLQVNLGPSTPWFITFSRNNEMTEISL